MQTKRLTTGLSLVEVALTLALAAALVAAVQIYYHTASEKLKTERTLAQATQIIAAVGHLFGMRNDFSGLSNATIIPEMDAQSVDGGHLESPFKGAIVVSSQQLGRWSLMESGLPLQACMRLASQRFGSALTRTVVNQQPLVAGRPLPAQLASLCHRGDDNQLTLYFR